MNISKVSWTAVQIMTLILTIAAIAGGTAYAASAVSKNNLLEKETAEEFARLDAGIDWKDIDVTQTELERENGKYVYDITFNAGKRKYEYEVSADDGTILAKEVEGIEQPAASEDISASSEDNSAASEDISDEMPDHTPGTDQTPVTMAEDTPETDNHPETDDSVAADNPQTADFSQDQYNGSRNYISVDQARRIALEHAGLTEDQVRFTKAMFENDDEDGEEFEIEFYAGNVEYDYDINALTGEILDFSKEVDD